MAYRSYPYYFTMIHYHYYSSDGMDDTMVRFRQWQSDEWSLALRDMEVKC